MRLGKRIGLCRRHLRLLSIAVVLMLPLPAAAQRVIVERTGTEIAVASADVAYGCSTEFLANGDMQVMLREYALPSGVETRSVQVWVEPPENFALSHAIEGCSVAPALDEGVILVAFAPASVTVDGDMYEITVAVVDATTMTVTATPRFDTSFPIFVWPALKIVRPGTRIHLFYNTSEVLMHHTWSGLSDLLTGAGVEAFIGIRAVPSHDVQIDTSGATPTLVVRSIHYRQDAWTTDPEVFRTVIDNDGNVTLDTQGDFLLYDFGWGRFLDGGQRVMAGEFYNAATMETSFLVESSSQDVSATTIPLLLKMENSTSFIDLVTGTRDAATAHFSGTVDSLLYEGTDWIVASRSAANSKLLIHRFPAAYPMGGAPAMGMPHEVDVTFCGAPTPNSDARNPQWSLNNNAVQVETLPSGLIVVAYNECIAPSVDAVMQIVVIDPDFPNADLAVTIDVLPTPAAPGEQLTYTVTATNSGADTNGHVHVEVPFGAPLENCSWTSVAAGGATGNDTGSGDIVDDVVLPPNASVTYTVQCTVPQGATGSVTTTATVWSPADEPSPADNTESAVVNLVPSSDLELAITADTDLVSPGGQVTYTLSVTNNGPSDTDGVSVAIVVPAGLSISTSTGCTEDPSGTPTCTFGALASGEVVEATLVAQENLSVTGSLVLMGSVSGDDSDPDGNNNSAQHTLGVGAVADLSVSITNGTSELITGDLTTYTITVQNNGPSDVSDANVQATLPATLGAASWSCSVDGDGSCGTVGSGGIDDTAVVLAQGEIAVYQLVATVLSEGANVEVAATVSSALADDGVPENNAATDTDTVQALDGGGEDSDSGCGCTQTSPPDVGFVMLCALLLWRRRRARC